MFNIIISDIIIFIPSLSFYIIEFVKLGNE